MENCYKKQQQEIATIEPRVFELKLSDADVYRLYEKAGSVGLSPEELLQSFIGDLVDGTYSNGSDERQYANEWIDRCGFSHTASKTLLQYLLKYDDLDSFISRLSYIEGDKEDLALWESELNDKNYPWDSLFTVCKEHPQGIRSYPSKQDWQNDINRQINGIKEDILYSQALINKSWNNFLDWTDLSNPNQQAEIKNVMEWKEKKDAMHKSVYPIH